MNGEQQPHRGSRREFLRGSLATAGVLAGLGAIPALGAESKTAPSSPPPPRISQTFKVGVIGLGHRGNWVAKFFKQHGGFEITACCDYFPEETAKFAEAYGIAEARRFTGLDGYRKLVESDVDIVAAESLPYFLPEHVTAAVAAGKHVYMAKPVASDVPGCLAVRDAAKKATARQLQFLVDYQASTDPVLGEMRENIRNGCLGRIAYVCTYGNANLWPEPTPEMPKPERLHKSLWLFDRVLGADACAQFDVHAIELAVWVLGELPVKAMGFAETRRPNPVLDGVDVLQTVATLGNGITWSHQHQSLRNNCDLTSEGNTGLVCRIVGDSATAVLPYSGKAYIRGGAKHGGGTVEDTYAAGVERNVGRFYENLIEGNFANETAGRAVDTQLAAILFREAGRRHGEMTMAQLLKENVKLEYDFTGFQR